MNREGLPPTLELARVDDVLVVRLNRAAKRNALDLATVDGLEAVFADPPEWARAAVVDADGEHFSAGLDFASLTDLDPVASLHHSRRWHAAFDTIERGRIAVVAVLRGAVIGGGLELASACHLRVAEPSAYFALPEGQRGLFVGGGASVRVPRLIGVHRVMDMMLTGRVISAADAVPLGLAQYAADEGAGYGLALELASKIATTPTMTTYAALHALPRIADADPDKGLYLESLMAAIASSSEEAQALMGEFLAGRGARVTQHDR
ncbi:enoyl-CoA hydratase [Nocardioides mangrovicus]|uniref:Enoyl-CoA hydratase n=1 Tax=Nocardioides mangrovicus TaxID=2478913 RepID=A0A3L8P2M1_9ACTN|nr:enoyl-CoA hydratase [Nocardioides mangrovicus]